MIIQRLSGYNRHYKKMTITCCSLLCVALITAGTPHVEQNHSGESLFIGIYFADGEVAAKIPELSAIQHKCKEV